MSSCPEAWGHALWVWVGGVLVEYYLLRLKQPEIRLFFALGLLKY